MLGHVALSFVQIFFFFRFKHALRSSHASLDLPHGSIHYLHGHGFLGSLFWCSEYHGTLVLYRIFPCLATWRHGSELLTSGPRCISRDLRRHDDVMDGV